MSLKLEIFNIIAPGLLLNVVDDVNHLVAHHFGSCRHKVRPHQVDWSSVGVLDASASFSDQEKAGSRVPRRAAAVVGVHDAAGDVAECQGDRAQDTNSKITIKMS